MKPGFFRASSNSAAHETIGFLSAPVVASPVRTWNEPSTLNCSGLVCLICSIICFFSFSAPVSRGARKGRVGPARKCQGLPFCGGAKKLRSSICFLGEPQTRRVSVSGRTKQKPAVPPARRRLSHLAVPARNRCRKRTMGRGELKLDTVGESRLFQINKLAHPHIIIR